MKTFSYLALLLLCTFALASAQDEVVEGLTISGKLAESNKQSVLFANVSLYSSVDSSFIGGAVSDETGKFVIPAERGKYFLKISYLGLTEKIVPNLVVDNQRVDVRSTPPDLPAQQVQGKG